MEDQSVVTLGSDKLPACQEWAMKHKLPLDTAMSPEDEEKGGGVFTALPLLGWCSQPLRGNKIPK